MQKNISKRVSFVLPWHYKWLNEKLFIRVFAEEYENGDILFRSMDNVFDSLQEPHTTNEEFLGTSLVEWNRDIADWKELEESIRRVNRYVTLGNWFNEYDLDWLISFNKDAWYKSGGVV